MASFDDPSDLDESLESKIQLRALQAWWQRHTALFSTHWLQAPAERRLAILRSSAPDMPATNSATRALTTLPEDLAPTDLILPEIAVDALTASGGRLLIMFMTRRLAPVDLAFEADMKFLKDLQAAGRLPMLDRGQVLC